MDISKLEPAERDPRKLRNTAILLTIFMIGGGFLILWAYKSFGERTSRSDRPSMEAKLDRSFGVVTADGVVRDILDLRGQISLVLILTKYPNVQSEPTLAALRSVLGAFKDEEKPRIVAFVLDGSDSKPNEMMSVLSEFGTEPKIWRVAADDQTKAPVRTFLKNRFRFGVYPEKRNGEFFYDTKLILLDQHLHIRGIPGSNEGWDFEKVAQMEAKFERAKKDHPDKELLPPPVTTEKLRELLLKSITYLYANPDEKGQSK